MAKKKNSKDVQIYKEFILDEQKSDVEKSREYLDELRKKKQTGLTKIMISQAERVLRNSEGSYNALLAVSEQYWIDNCPNWRGWKEEFGIE